MKKFQNQNNILKLIKKKTWIIVSIVVALIVSYLILYFFVINRTYYQFEIGEEQLSISLKYNDNIIDNYATKPRTYLYSGELPENWEHDYWNTFLMDSDNDDVLKNYIKQINSVSTNFSNNQIEILIASIQGSIEYDHAKAESDNSLVQYPIETLSTKMGICSDISLLLAKLLILLDYKIVLFSFPKMNHMAIGISVPKGYDNFNSGYCFIETTSYSLIGRVPEKILGEIFNEQPNLIFPQINGKKSYKEISNIAAKYSFFEEKYGHNYLLCNALKKRILNKMNRKNKIIDSLTTQYELSCNGTLSQDEYDVCVQLNKQISNETNEYNDLVRLYNEKTE